MRAKEEHEVRKAWPTRQRISASILILLGGLCFGIYARAVPNGQAVAIYFVAATPAQEDNPRTYPAALYIAGNEQKLSLVRQIFTVDDYFRDFADDLHGNMYLAAQNGIFVIHEDDPARSEFMSLDKFDDFPCWGAIKGDSVPAAVQYCYGDQIIWVGGNAESGKSRIGDGGWAAFKFLQYSGQNGGPFPSTPPLAEIAGANLVMPLSVRPEVVLAQLPPEFNAKPELRRLVWILASTDGYLAVWILPEHMVGGSVGTDNPRHTEPLDVLVLYKLTNQWKTLELPTTITSNTAAPVRILGDWLVTTIMDWRPGPAGSGSGSPGMKNERESDSSTSPLPNIWGMYANKFLDLYIPGKLVIENLADGRKLTLDTGQEDSEVVAIRDDGEILYRVNDSIYSAKIAGERITARTLVVKDAGVPDIHWAFWGPAPKSAQPSGSAGEVH